MSAGARELFAGVFARGAVEHELNDAAWVQALLDVEVGLARALARARLVPEAAAEGVVAAARPAHVSIAGLAAGTGEAGSPIPALVKQLESGLPLAAAAALHRGATSQDILDSAIMLIAKRALAPVLADLEACAGAAVQLARTHRSSVMLGRTLLQAAVPITFGFKAAGWAWALDDARSRLANVRENLPVQFGGAAGTLASLGAHGVEVAKLLAAELGLSEPVLPWHTLRAPVLELGAACGIAAAALGKIARDVSLLAQGEIDEVREPVAAGRGGSSTMPHKQNPVGSVATLSCTRRVPGLCATLLVAAEQEHERAAGAWHAEWETLTDLFGLLGSAASWMREVLSGLTIDVERMRANFEAAAGLPLAERLSTELALRLGRKAAEALVRTAVERARSERLHLRDVFARDADLSQALLEGGIAPEQLERVFDPSEYLGSSSQFIDRVLAAHEARRPAG
jgi:3-carboxy-cis,cis-muconate cycloisomerase